MVSLYCYSEYRVTVDYHSEHGVSLDCHIYIVNMGFPRIVNTWFPWIVIVNTGFPWI